MRFRISGISLVGLSLLVGCTPEDAVTYAPSLTMVRTGEVELDVYLPEDKFIPGIVIAPEQYELGDGSGGKTDLSGAEDLTDPKALSEHSSYTYAVADGDLFDLQAEKDVSFDDVAQGSIGNCYFVAALSAVLYADQDHSIRDGLIREVKGSDGRVTKFVVRFYSAENEVVDVEVDAQLVRRDNLPVYARSKDTTAGNEEWAISLIEKAYAQWHGGYPKIGDGGWAGDVMQALTRSTATYRVLKNSSDKTIVKSIKEGATAHRPMVASTFMSSDAQTAGLSYSGTGVYAEHCYTVLGIVEKDGLTYVRLRNPWGEVEPAGDGVDDGVFDMELSQFRRLYEDLTIGGGTKPDRKTPAAVDDLDLFDERGELLLAFTATGDDGHVGMAQHYDLRISKTKISESNFYSQPSFPIADPKTPGSEELVDISSLDFGTFYAAVKVEDEAGHISTISNVLEFEIGEF